MPDKKVFLNSGASAPDLPKSTFDKSFSNHLSAKFGLLYPCLVEEAVAGSSYVINPSCAFDMMPMKFPVQSNMKFHMSVFNVPFRILMRSYKDFFSRVGEHKMPYINRAPGWRPTGSLADYMGIPSSVDSTVSRSLSLRYLHRGFISYLSQLRPLAPLTEGGSDIDLRYQMPYGSSLDDILTRRPQSSYFCCAITNKFIQPFSSKHLYISYLSSSTSLSDYNYRLVVFLYNRRTSQFYPFLLNGSSTSSSFSPGSTPGTYSTGSQSTLNLVSGTNLYSRTIDFFLTDSDIRLINSAIVGDDYFVYIGFCYPFNAIYTYGYPLSPFGIDGISHGVQSSQLLDLKPDVENQYELVESLLYPGNLTDSLSYDCSVGVIEDSVTHFDSVDGAPPLLPVNALPFRAYEFIYNKYFRNQQVDPFYKDGVPCYNEFLTNDGDGADSTTPVDFFHVPYEYDEFTTALLSPQMGFAPLVGITTNEENTKGIMHMIPLVDGEPDPSQAYDIAVGLGDGGTITGISNYDEVADKTSVHRLSEVIDFGISINDFRNVSAFQRMKEKMAKAGFQYQDLVKEFFGTTPPIGEEFPEYVGGFTRDVYVGKIQNQALTEEHALGEFAGVGGMNGSGKSIRVFVKEPSYIMAVCWFSVTPTYSQAIPKHFLKSHPLDYFIPTLNSIGPQPIMKNEIAPLQLDESHLFDVFGYQRPWYDYVSRRDECHGNFRGSQRNFLLQRFFLEAPDLTERFISIHSEDLTDIFNVLDDTDKFYGVIRFNIRCKSPVARISVPRIIG